MSHVLFLLVAILLLPLKVFSANNWPEVINELSVFPDKHELTPIVGGASNENYHLLHEGLDYFVRFSPEGIQALYADLHVEHEVLQKLADFNVSARPCYFEEEKRVLVTDFIHHNDVTVNLLDPVTRQKVFALLHTIEDSKVKISRVFHPYQDVLKLVGTAEEKACNNFSQDYYDDLLPALARIDAVLAKNPRKSLCHLDLHNKNVLQDDDRFWIVDWEYAAMSHPFLVLASMASIEHWDDQQMQALLTDYMGQPTQEDFYCLYLYRIVADLFWTTWNHVQNHVSLIDNPYDVWEKDYYDAARERIHSKCFDEAMNALDKQEVVLLFGPPGCGKGTFSQVAKERGYAHISAGDLIRLEIQKQTEIGRNIETLVNRGEYIDPAITFQLVKNRVVEYVATGQPFIIDGYGRSFDDAARLRGFLKEINAKVRVVFLDASDTVCLERISHRLICSNCPMIYNQNMGHQANSLCPHCKQGHLQERLNDTQSVTEKRLKFYRESIYPAYYTFVDEFPTVTYNTESDVESCLRFYNSLLDEWK